MTLFINPVTRPASEDTGGLGSRAIRSLLLFLSTALNFVALQYLQLVETMSIIFATPLLVALLAGPLLGERIGPRRLVAIGVGFARRSRHHPAGIGDHASGGGPLSVAGTFAYAFYAITTADPRDARLVANDHGVFGPRRGGADDPGPALRVDDAGPRRHLDPVRRARGLRSVGHWLLILAHARAPAAILSPFIYTQIVWMLALGYLIFGDWPDLDAGRRRRRHRLGPLPALP